MITRRPGGRTALTRREAIALGVGALTVAVVPAAVRTRPRLVRRTMPAMGTLAEIAVVADGDPARAHAAIDAALAELAATERAMTRYSPGSDVGRANAGAAREAVTVDATTAAVLREALAWAEATDGAFDPCIGRMVALWDVAHRTAPPAPAVARRLAARRFYRHLDVDTWHGRPAVRFTDPEAALDLGGIACGFGVDRAVRALRRHGVDRGLVNVGGDIYALGTSPEGDAWQVGIQSPEDPARVIARVAVRDGAVATSGDYMQFFVYRGARYHHLLDPATGAPRRTPMHSVTVTAATCLVADAATTAVFGMTAPDAARTLRARAPGAVAVHRA
jgi:thiamine biosynthesis lipoprotein